MHRPTDCTYVAGPPAAGKAGSVVLHPHHFLDQRADKAPCAAGGMTSTDSRAQTTTPSRVVPQGQGVTLQVQRLGAICL